MDPDNSAKRDLEQPVDHANEKKAKTKTGENMPETYVEGFHSEDVISKMKYRRLTPCVTKAGEPMHVSILSFGASSLGGCFRETDDQEGINVVHAALKGGMNLIDTAPWYGHGHSETVLGKALKGVPRQAYYMHTKCGRYEADVEKMFDFSAQRTTRSIQESLERLGCGYLDCVQVHDPEYAESVDIIVNETLPALEKARDAGLIRMIGLTGFPLSLHREILQRSKVKIDTCLLYCHYSLNDTSLLDDLLPFLNEKRVGCINASPISMGLLSRRGPPSWHPAPALIKETCRNAVEYCNQRDVDISKLAIDFTLREKSIPTTLVSTASLKRIDANLQAAYHVGQLSPHEERTLGEIREKFFIPLKNASWEGIEVEKYREMLAAAKSGEKVGTLSTR